MDSPTAPVRRWPSLWFTALSSLIAQLWLCRFFSFGHDVPLSIDVNPSNLWKYAYHFPPTGEFLALNWLGIANLPPTLNPFSLAAAHISEWLFFTAYAPVIGTLALLAMAAFLRELGLVRPAALFGGVIYAWQGDLLPFVFPGHYGYITTWPFFAIAAWGALRALRSRYWAYSVVAGAGCGMMVGLQPDRGAIASLLIAAFYLAPVVTRRTPWLANLQQLALCAGLALLISLAAFLALFQSYIVGVKLGNSADRDQTFATATQFSLGPAETLTYLAPGVFGWHSSSLVAPYWGWIGQPPGWQKTHQGLGSLNLAISTTGTIASLLTLLGACLLLPGLPARFFADTGFTDRQVYHGRLLLILGVVALLLSWGYHTPLYRPLFALPLMDKWRDPLKWLDISNFAFITLSAFGLHYALRSLTPESNSRLRRPLQLFLGLVTGLLVAGLLISYPIAVVVAGNLNDASYEPVAIADIMHTLHVSLASAAALSAATWLLLLAAWRGEKLRRWEIVNPWLHRIWKGMLAPEIVPTTLAVALAALAALQLGWVATHFIESHGLANLTASNDLIDALKAEGPAVRVAVPAPQDPLLNYLLQNQFAGERISSVDISAASRIPDDLAAFFGALEKHPARLWFLAGVRNVAVGQQVVAHLNQDPEIAANLDKAGGYVLEDTGPAGDPSHSLVHLKDALAKATFVYAAEVIPDEAGQLKRLVDPKWDPRKTILLAQPYTGLALGQIRPDAPPPSVEVTTYDAHEIRIAVTSSSSGYILINDRFDPDWQVEINGRSAPLLRADYILRAIPIAPRNSSIDLRYVAHYHVAGIPLPVVAMNIFSDSIMLAAWLVAAFALWRKKPEEPIVIP